MFVSSQCLLYLLSRILSRVIFLGPDSDAGEAVQDRGDTVPVGLVSARCVVWKKTGVKERKLSVNLKSEGSYLCNLTATTLKKAK